MFDLKTPEFSIRDGVCNQVDLNRVYRAHNPSSAANCYASHLCE